MVWTNQLYLTQWEIILACHILPQITSFSFEQLFGKEKTERIKKGGLWKQTLFYSGLTCFCSQPPDVIRSGLEFELKSCSRIYLVAWQSLDRFTEHLCRWHRPVFFLSDILLFRMMVSLLWTLPIYTVHRGVACLVLSRVVARYWQRDRVLFTQHRVLVGGTIISQLLKIVGDV